MKVLFVGQSTFRIALRDGPTLLTDPWFKNRRLWRKTAPAFGPEQIGQVHYLLSSHNHLDHIDDLSLGLALRQGAGVIGSVRVARRAEKFGIAKATALRPGEEKNFGKFSVLATPAFHPLAKDAIGFLIRAEEKQLYFSGDTRLHPDLVRFLQNHGPVEIAFLQASCARYFGKDDGLDHHSAAALALAFHPRLVIPMHLHARFKKKVDLEELRQNLDRAGIGLKLLQPGEEIE